MINGTLGPPLLFSQPFIRAANLNRLALLFEGARPRLLNCMLSVVTSPTRQSMAMRHEDCETDGPPQRQLTMGVGG